MAVYFGNALKLSDAWVPNRAMTNRFATAIGSRCFPLSESVPKHDDLQGAAAPSAAPKLAAPHRPKPPIRNSSIFTSGTLDQQFFPRSNHRSATGDFCKLPSQEFTL